MSNLNFSISINAPSKKVWQVLWSDTTYREWTKMFQDGSYAVSEWKEGSKVHFLTTDGSGMFSIIKELKEPELMSFKHLGNIKNFIEQPESEETKKWVDSLESYSLKEENGTTLLEVNLIGVEQYHDFFNRTFPKALLVVKELAEMPIEISIHTSVNADINKVWECWTNPKHIINWNNASPDWCTPRAENDLKVGGKFIYRMEARDGSFGFDFAGIYDEIKYHELISYTIADGRKVTITFVKDGDSIVVNEIFEAEMENSLELQKGGWQAILDNFKKVTESN